MAMNYISLCFVVLISSMDHFIKLFDLTATFVSFLSRQLCEVIDTNPALCPYPPPGLYIDRFIIVIVIIIIIIIIIIIMMIIIIIVFITPFL